MGPVGDIDIEIHGQRRPGVVREIAERQHGIISRTQLRKVMGRGSIDHAVLQGRLAVIHRGVYALSHTALRREGWLLAAVLAGGEGAALSHASAAEMWGIGPVAGCIEISVPRTRRWNCDSVTVHRPHRLADDITFRSGVPITTVERTLLDLAARCSQLELRRMLNEAEYQRLIDRCAVADRLSQTPNIRGARRLRLVLATNAAPSRSELERRFHQLVNRSRVPAPLTNRIVEIRGERFEVDAWWPEQRLVVELDGARAHATPNRFELDRRRDELFVSEGIRVVRVTWKRVTTDSADLIHSLTRLLHSPGRH